MWGIKLFFKVGGERSMCGVSCSREFQELMAEPVNAQIFHVKFSLAMLETFDLPQHTARSRNLQVNWLWWGSACAQLRGAQVLRGLLGMGEGRGQHEETDVV